MPRIDLGTVKKKDSVPTTGKKDAQKIYQDKRWKILRAEKLRVNPLCEQCEREGRSRLAEEVHHRIPFSQGSTPQMRDYLAFDLDNLESLCTECHRSRHKK